MHNKLLTVVIPSYNSEFFMSDCLKSISSSLDDRVEYILIDGGSSDSTLKIVKPFESIFSMIISEKDKGQSDALNKGFNLAKGRYLTWLNSDDILIPGSMKKVLNIISKEKSQWYACNQIYINEKNQIVKFLESGSFENSSWKFGRMHVFGPSTIFSKMMFNQLGAFDIRYNYCMDTEYWYRAAASNYKYKRINVYFWGFRVHSNSKTSSSINGIIKPSMLIEDTQIRKQYFYPNLFKFSKHYLFFIRLVRILKGHYPKAYLLTILNRGKTVL